MAKVTVKTKVAMLLRSDKRTRNSDKYLITKYWQEYQGMSKEESERMYKLMKDSAPLETITRARRQIQNTDGLYPATARIRKKRLHKQEEIKATVIAGE